MGMYATSPSALRSIHLQEHGTFSNSSMFIGLLPTAFMHHGPGKLIGWLGVYSRIPGLDERTTLRESMAGCDKKTVDENFETNLHNLTRGSVQNTVPSLVF